MLAVTAGIKRKLYRKLATLGVANNSLNPFINLRYLSYSKKCQNLSKRLKPDVPEFQRANPIQNPCHFGAILPIDVATQLSEIITDCVEKGVGVSTEADNPVFIGIRNPLTLLGNQIVEIFHNSTLDKRIRSHFGSYYRISWLDCYRTIPAKIRKRAWLWHSDNVPVRMLKVQLLLTNTTATNGAMRILSHEDTMKFRRADYFGDVSIDRTADIDELASEHGISYSQQNCEGNAGDVFLFDNNDLHCAYPPEENFRDALTYLLLPSPRPWYEVLEESGNASIESNPGGYPLWPNRLLKND